MEGDLLEILISTLLRLHDTRTESTKAKKPQVGGAQSDEINLGAGMIATALLNQLAIQIHSPHLA